MIERAAIYDPATGAILRVVTTSDVFALAGQTGPGEAWAYVDDAEAAVDDTSHMVEAGRVVERPAFAGQTSFLAFPQAEVVIAAPPGSLARMPGSRADVLLPDGVLRFTPPREGSFTIQVAPPFPFRAFVVKVKAE